jgi:hypothetical protein
VVRAAAPDPREGMSSAPGGHHGRPIVLISDGPSTIAPEEIALAVARAAHLGLRAQGSRRSATAEPRTWATDDASVARRVGLNASARGALGRDAVTTDATIMRRCVQVFVLLLIAHLAEYAHGLPTM